MWNERYSTDEYIYGREPNTFLRKRFSAIPQGKVLCLGEGEGRNAVFLARQGYQVTAVDSSEVGREKALRLAEEHGVAINYIHADLAEFDAGENQWDGIVSIFCHLPPPLRQRLYQQIPVALKRGGVFLLEAYTPAQLKFGTGGPADEAMLMTADKLREEISGLDFEMLQEIEREVVEGTHHTGHAAVLQALALRPRRRYQVSSNRGAASHKLRYVESGGGEGDGICRACQPALKPDSGADRSDE